MVIWPTLAAPLRSRNPPLAVWRRRSNAALRATYLVARAGGLALQARGGGRLLLIIDAAAADDVVGAVLVEALHALTDGLRKALAPQVEVGVLIVEGPAPSSGHAAALRGEARVARHVRRWLEQPGAGSLIVAAARRRAPTPG